MLSAAIGESIFLFQHNDLQSVSNKSVLNVKNLKWQSIINNLFYQCHLYSCKTGPTMCILLYDRHRD